MEVHLEMIYKFKEKFITTARPAMQIYEHIRICFERKYLLILKSTLMANILLIFVVLLAKFIYSRFKGVAATIVVMLFG